MAAHCARSVRSAPSEARAAPASRSSTPDGFFLQTAKRANATSMNQQRRQAAAKPRAMRKRLRFESPSKAAALAANALTGQRTSCSTGATFSHHCPLPTEAMATLRHGATCGADVAAACANALTSWSDFVRQSVTPSSPSSGYRRSGELSALCPHCVRRLSGGCAHRECLGRHH